MTGHPKLIEPGVQKSDWNKECNVNHRYSGISTGVRSCLKMREQTAFESLLNEYRAKKNSDANLPDIPFGKSCKSSNETVKELLKPLISENENSDDTFVRQSSKKSYNNYDPSEQIDRQYGKPFDKLYRHGKRTNADKEGNRTKNRLIWINQDPTFVGSCIQADFLERTRPRLGSARTQGSDECTFGKSTNQKDERGVERVLQTCGLLNLDDKLWQKRYSEHINTLRLRLKKRKPTFRMLDLQRAFLSRVEGEECYMKMDQIYAVLAASRIYPNQDLFGKLLRDCNYIRDEKVSWKTVIDLLDWNCDLPSLPHIRDQDVNNVIGTPDVKLEDEVEDLYKKISIQEIKSKGDEVRVADVISPSIFALYGISNSDLSKDRTKAEIRMLFEKAGFEVNEDEFEATLEEEARKSGCGKVSVAAYLAAFEKL